MGLKFPQLYYNISGLNCVAGNFHRTLFLSTMDLLFHASCAVWVRWKVLALLPKWACGKMKICK